MMQSEYVIVKQRDMYEEKGTQIYVLLREERNCLLNIVSMRIHRQLLESLLHWSHVQ